MDDHLSVVLRRLSRPAEARDHAERAVAFAKLLVKAHPETLDYRAVLAESHLNRGLARLALGDPAGAAADIRQAAALYDSLPSPAGGFCSCPRVPTPRWRAWPVRPDRACSAEERRSEADRAMALLHQAVAMGYSNVNAYRNQDALDPLRDRDDFRLLIADLVMPAEPFTPER